MNGSSKFEARKKLLENIFETHCWYSGDRLGSHLASKANGVIVRRVYGQVSLQTSHIGEFLKLIPKYTTFPYEELKKRVFENDMVMQNGSEKIFCTPVGFKICFENVPRNKCSSPKQTEWSYDA